MVTRRVKRYVIAASVVALLVAAYTLVGFFAVPHLLRSNLRGFVSSHYGRTVSVGDIHFNPFTFTLDVADFSLPDTDGQAMLAFGRLHVDLEIGSLWRLGPSFREIVLERPLIRTVVRRDGTLNLADLGKGFASTTPAPKPEPNAQPMRLFIDRFAVIAGSGTFEDRTRSTPFRAELKPIAFELRQFSTRARTGNGYSLTAASSRGERLDWNGSILLEPLSSHGTFEVTSLQASTIWSYLQQPLPLEIPSGTIGLKGDYDFRLSGDAPAITLDVHDTTVADLKLRPRAGTSDYVSLTKLDIQETRVDVAKHAVDIGKVALTGGEISAWLDAKGRLNLLELAPTSGSTPTAPAIAANQGASAPASNAPAPGTAAAPAPTVTTSGPAPVWTVSAPDIAVEGLKVSTEDRQVTPAIALVFNPLSIHVAGFNTTPEARLDITAKTAINSTASLDATAQVTPHSGDMSAHVDLARLDLATFQPIIAQRTAMTLQSGRLATKLDIRHPADGSIAVKGEAQVSNLRTVDNELKQSFIKWKDLRVTGIEYGSQPASLRIASIVAREPYARVIIAKNRSVNVSEVLAGPNKAAAGRHEAASGKRASATLIDANGANANGVDAKIAEGMTAGAKDAGAKSADTVVAGAKDAGAKSADAEQTTVADAAAAVSKRGRHSRKSRTASAEKGAAVTAPDSSAMPMAIGKVQIINGSANYADFWIQPNFAVGIQTLNGTVTGLSSNPSSRAKVQLEGKVDRYAPVQIGGEMNLLAATVYTDITMSFKGLELTTMTPYSGRFAGYKIDKGKLSVDLSYKVDQRKLVAEQRFVIDQLQLGDPVESPDAVHLPLKLAVALLKDRNGVIDLPLPITGSLDDPQFKLGPIIWKAVVNLLVKVATAPFALLGQLFGGGAEMNFIDFPAGSAEVDAAAKQKLTALTKALQERPQLNLDVPIVYSTQLDRPVLAAKMLRGKLLARERTDHPQKKGERPRKAKGADAIQVASATKVADGTKGADGAKDAAPSKGADAAQGTNGADAPEDPVLADPLEHYRLLLAEYQAELGKDAELPPSAQAIQNAKSKKDTPPVESAIPDLESALIAHIQVPEVELQELGKRRTQSIQDVLLTDGGIDGSRVFVINGPPKSDSGDKVRVAMSLK